VEDQAKRRKSEELNYQAFNLRNDLATAGVQCVPNLIGRSRSRLHGPVNMDKVKLVASVSRESSPDLDAYEEMTLNDYVQMLNCCKHFYTTTTGLIPTPSEEAATDNGRSSCSSTSTPIVSDDSEINLEISPKLEAHADQVEDDESSEPRYISASLDSKIMTLESSLEYSESAR